MFGDEVGSGSAVTAATITAVIRHLQAALLAPPGGGVAVAESDCIDQITALEQLKSVACAVQAQRTATFAAAREAQLARLVSGQRQDNARRDIGAQIGLARRVSPRTGSRLVGLAKVLTAEMPHTMNALSAGRIDEYQATLLAGETATLSREHREQVDAELADRLGTMTATQAQGAAARIGYRLDPEQAVKRLRKAENDRCVTIRKAPDTMTYLTALLPVAHGVAVYAALLAAATTATATGDPRSKGALMADEFLTRALRHPATDQTDTTGSTGSAASDSGPVSPEPGTTDTSAAPADLTADLTAGLATVPAGVSIEIHLVMTDRTLLDGDQEPAILNGYGPIPAPLARHLARGNDTRTTVWVRRLYADPETGDLTGGDTRRRLFPPAARQFLISRDQTCRTPWCGAPIRHADHIQPHAEGGPTDLDNAAGLCAGCNQNKENPGWTTHPELDASILTTTPTGHRYRSHPPPPPRSAPWADTLTETQQYRIIQRRLAHLTHTTKAA